MKLVLIIFFYFNSLLAECCINWSFTWHQSQTDEPTSASESLFVPSLNIWPSVNFICSLETPQGCTSWCQLNSSRLRSSNFLQIEQKMKVLCVCDWSSNKMWTPPFQPAILGPTCAVCFSCVVRLRHTMHNALVFRACPQ